MAAWRWWASAGERERVAFATIGHRLSLPIRRSDGIVAGAAAGGLLGSQIGSGNGKTLATVGGAVAGGFVGNQVQKRVTAREVWITQVKMKDGSLRNFEHETAPAWKAGSLVRVHGKTLVAVAT